MNSTVNTDGASLPVEDIVNTAIYPLQLQHGRAYATLLLRCREAVAEEGVCLLHDFVTPRALDLIRGEAVANLDSAFYCHNTHNAYLQEDDPQYPQDHPRRRRLQTDVGSIAYDFLPRKGVLCRLYQWDPLTRFIGDVLGYENFYRSIDPLGALSINVFEPGGSHAWHFDESHFTVTLMVQPADAGGLFQYAPNIRSPGDDAFEVVGGILDGDRNAVRVLSLEPGTLSIFAGHNTLHRVTGVEGNNHRLVPVLAYATRPDAQNSEAVRELFWGRKNPDSVQLSGS